MLSAKSKKHFAPLLVCALVGVLLAVDADNAVGQQSPVTPWTRITETTARNTDEITLARTGDGTLHVVWMLHKNRLNSYIDTRIGPAGKVAAPSSPVLENWSALNKPALIVGKDAGLELLFGGIRTTDTSDPYSKGCLFRATSDANGSSWRLEKGCGTSSHSIYSSSLGAAIAPDGTPVVAWGANVQVGLGEKMKEQKFLKGCCSYAGNVAVDGASGDVVAGWYSNASKDHGLYTLTVLPTVGEKQFVPGSATPNRDSSLSLSVQMPLSGRLDARGVYVAYCAGYPTCESINVWRHGETQAQVVDKTGGARHVNIAAAPEGRLWVMWARQARLFAVRSNRAATRFGPVVKVAPPKGTSQVWRLKGDGSRGPLDLFAHISSPDGLATWHARVFPPLSLSASPNKFAGTEGATITFAVTDVGDPVEGAKVSVGGKTAITDAQGRISIAFPENTKAGTLTARASKNDYTDATASVSVNAPK